MKKVICLSFVLFFIVSSSFAQNLSLRPILGLKFNNAYAKESKDGKIFSTNHFLRNEFIYAGIMLQYNINKKWHIASGVDVGSIGYDFKIKYPKREGGSYLVSKRTSNGSLVGIPIQVGYTFKDVQFIRLNTQTKFMKMLGLDKKDLMYLMLFKLQLVGGIAFNHVQKYSDEGETSYIGSQVNNFPVEWRESTYNVVRRNGMSISAGINIQFHNYGRDRFLISLLYEQGIQNRLDVPVRYGVGAEELGRTRLGSRGSGFILKASYPINLYRFKKNKFVEE